MKTKFSVIPLIIAILFLSSCSAGQAITPTLTPAPTSSPSPTATPVPTQTSTPISVSLAYSPVPRWMILGQPGYGVEILGEDWNYTNDRWGDTYACIDYTREKEPYLFFEQCFAFTQPDLTFESQRDSFVNEDFETLEPNNAFGDVGQISLTAKRLEDNSTKFIKFFELIGVEEYILLVEMNMVTDETSPLQTIYEEQAANIINYVLQNMLEKSHLIPRPTATPLSPTQESFYFTLGENLITETEASALYGGTWEALGDFVSPKRTQVCRDFEDRTNADVLWVRFTNCIVSVKDGSFEERVENFKEPGDILLESRHKYDDKFVLYGYQNGHTFFYALLLHKEYIYFVTLESRTLAGQKVEDVFAEDIDDFIYGVLMANTLR